MTFNEYLQGQIEQEELNQLSEIPESQAINNGINNDLVNALKQINEHNMRAYNNERR